MTFSTLLYAFLTWCAAHPAEVTLAVGAVVSCFYKCLSKYPRMRALFDLLAHLGVNVPGVAEALSRLLTGKVKAVAKLGAVVALLLAAPDLSACAPLTPQDRTEVGTYAGEQSACIAATPDDKPSIDACRAKVKAKWCAQWAARFDASVCQ